MPTWYMYLNFTSSSLIRNNFLFMVLLTVSPLTVNGFNANVKYPSSLTSSAETTRYVTDWFLFVNSIALFSKKRSTFGFLEQEKPESSTTSAGSPASSSFPNAKYSWFFLCNSYFAISILLFNIG